MRKLVANFALILVAFGFVACGGNDEAFEKYVRDGWVKEWIKPKKSFKSSDAKIKTPDFAVGVDAVISNNGEVGLFFKADEDYKTNVLDIKLYPRTCGVIIRIPKKFENLSDRQKRIVGSEEQQESLRWFTNSDEDIAYWNAEVETDDDIKGLWETMPLVGVRTIRCVATDIEKAEVITDSGTFTYEFK